MKKIKIEPGEKKMWFLLALLIIFGLPSLYLSLSTPITESLRLQIPLLTIEVIICFFFRQQTIAQGAKKFDRSFQSYTTSLVIMAVLVNGLIDALFFLLMMYTILFLSAIFIKEEDQPKKATRPFKTGPNWPVEMKIIRN